MTNSRKTHINKNGVSIKDNDYCKCILNVYKLIAEADQISAGPDLTTKTTVTNPHNIGEYILKAKQDGIIAGIEEIKFLLKQKKLGSLTIKFNINDGHLIRKNQIIARIKAPHSDILKYERFILNFIQRLSGIATITHNIVAKIKKYDVLLCPTRKTLWGLADKKGVLIGGGGTHRLSLEDGILIKENHIAANGNNIEITLDNLLKNENKNIRMIEVEVENYAEVKKAAFALSKTKNPCIMLDNFTPVQAKKSIKYLRDNYPSILIEISGGITPKNILSYAALKPDIISMGYLTNNAHSLDISMLAEN